MKRQSIVIFHLISMKRSRNKSNWGEWPETYESKYQIHDVFTAFDPDKRTQIEMLGPIDEPDTDTMWVFFLPPNTSFHQIK